MTTTSKLEMIDKQLLNVIQSRFPLAEEAYGELGHELGISQEEVLRRIGQLKRWNVVREINAIFDTRRLGYKTTLVAMRYPEDKLDAGAQRINRHPGVSHNYARIGHFNLWFTLAVPPGEDLEAAVERMAQETGAEVFRMMPTIRFFKIGVNFDMVEQKGAAYDYYSPDGYGGVSSNWNKVEPLTDFDIQAIRELQKDLPLEPRPFDAMAARLGLTVSQLFEVIQDFQRRGVMRRYSAVLHHRRAGFTDNAMGVWRVPEERAEEVGKLMAASPWVTHCYERPTFPDWLYTHFTMIHASSREQCEEVARDISAQTGITDYKLLYSTREYKKTRVRYFVEEEG